MGTDFMVDADVFVGVFFVAFSPPSSSALVAPEAAPLPLAINPLANATLTTPPSHRSHRDMRGDMGPWTAHKT